jgi:hypothetical protein
MSFNYGVKHIKIRALHKDVIVSDMDFGEVTLKSGIVLRSDNGQSHGVKPRWAKVYKVGPEQQDVIIGQWILIEHGRWTRKMTIDDGDGVKEIQKVDIDAIIAVSDEPPSAADILIKDSV